MSCVNSRQSRARDFVRRAELEGLAFEKSIQRLLAPIKGWREECPFWKIGPELVQEDHPLPRYPSPQLDPKKRKNHSRPCAIATWISRSDELGATLRAVADEYEIVETKHSVTSGL
jgi:hypothetical protein